MAEKPITLVPATPCKTVTHTKVEKTRHGIITHKVTTPREAK